ncbi:pyruvate kinase [Lacipirellula limnantheis]|uniref:pyruvate kinase n=1 Tax=Lacipirellula limnantheis TaxID=2528024 RepID=A0A517TYN9_9BACT|nr:pyruvate kinase [Lacipirellula limnantheis]QDT73500.1 Pyruvate kinase I [Lacipirellula limnantheis]
MTQQRRHTGDTPEIDHSTLDELIRELTEVQADMLDLEARGMAQATHIHSSYHQSARNLLHYLSLRRRDIRALQSRLAEIGLSSLGQSESHVLATVESLLNVLHQLAGQDRSARTPRAHALAFSEGRALLSQHTEALFGRGPGHRRVRIMVTIPSEAASDPQLIESLLASGMDCARINCAHDDPVVWERLIANLRSAERTLGKTCKVLMDLAGPKLRTGPIERGAKVVKWRPQRDSYGRVTAPARIWIYAEGDKLEPPSGADACLPVPRDWLATLGVGDRLNFVDARGARRFLWVVGAEERGRWAEAVRTAYITPGTELTIVSRAARTLSSGAIAQVGDLPPGERAYIVKLGDALILTRDLMPSPPENPPNRRERSLPVRIGCTLPEIFDDVRAGERIWIDDGKIGGVIEAVQADEIVVRVTHARIRGEKLRADKGINLPDSSLRLPALTAKDLADLPFVAAHADLVGYSFVRTAADVCELEDHLARLGGEQLGIVLKIETRRAFEQLPSLLLATMRTPRDGVMIARGDLAIECGYERMAEVQEQILWVCEAAHVPVIWATQVLEGLTKDGQPSRAEISDAAIAQRAECVMLNKGSHILQAVSTLDDILRRMDAHQSKKSSMLRPLELARRFSAESF